MSFTRRKGKLFQFDRPLRVFLYLFQELRRLVGLFPALLDNVTELLAVRLHQRRLVGMEQAQTFKHQSNTIYDVFLTRQFLLKLANRFFCRYALVRTMPHALSCLHFVTAMANIRFVTPDCQSELPLTI